MAPAAGLAVDLAEGMMQQHVAAAGRVGTAVVADHRVETEQRLQWRAFEPVIEQVAGAAREQFVHFALRRQRQRAELPAEGERFPEIPRAAQVGRRRAHQQRAQQLHGAPQHRVVVGQAGRVAHAEAARLGARVLQTRSGAERVAVGQRQVVLHRALDDAQAVLGEAQVGDHGRVEQADRVAGGRVAEAGVEFLGHRRAPDDVAALEDSYLEA